MFDFSTAELTAWLAAHEQWILIAVAAAAFLESLAIVGIIVPGVAILFAIAAAAGSAEIPLLHVLAAAFCGAVLGDGISFFIGRHYHHIVRQLPPFTTHPEWIEKGERFFQRYGLISVVIGRFVGPIRPVLPLVAGMLEMRPNRFLTINAISALGWAPVYILPGYLVGSAAENSTLNHRHFIFLIAAILGGWLVAQLLWWFKSSIIKRKRKIILACTLFMVSIIAIELLYWLLDTATITQLNQATAHLFLSLRHEKLDYFFIGLTQLGYFKPMALWGTTIFVTLVFYRQWYLAGIWATTTLVASALIEGLKIFFAVPRPQLIFEPLTSFAYPSGHTCIIIVFFFLIFIIASPGLSFRWQKPLLSSAVIIATLMALSRLYLGVHWLTDIISGFFLAVAICSATLLGLLHKPFKATSGTPIIVVSALTVLLNLGLWVIPHWSDLKQQFQPLHSTL